MPDRFAFGENWRAFSRIIDEDRIVGAMDGLAGLFGPEGIRGKTFLDIGCGSGVHALAALRLGAANVTAIDLDPASVETAYELLRRHARDGSWRVLEADVFSLASLGRFDVVYSWGVLHHTGDLARAMRCAADRVNPGGALCVAIYGHTAMCWFWKHEKRLYSRSGPAAQRMIRATYIAWVRALYTAKAAMRGRLFRYSEHRKNYRERGMDFDIDVHDWLGGYPYESIRPEEARQALAALGFHEERSFIRSQRSLGLTGSACNEFVFRRES